MLCLSCGSWLCRVLGGIGGRRPLMFTVKQAVPCAPFRCVRHPLLVRHACRGADALFLRGLPSALDKQFAGGVLSLLWVAVSVGARWRRRSRLDLSIGHNPPQTDETCLESFCASPFSGKREQGHHLTRFYRRDSRDAYLNPLRSEKAKPTQSSENCAGLWRPINLNLIERMPTLYLGACGLATAHE